MKNFKLERPGVGIVGEAPTLTQLLLQYPPRLRDKVFIASGIESRFWWPHQHGITHIGYPIQESFINNTLWVKANERGRGMYPHPEGMIGEIDGKFILHKADFQQELLFDTRGNRFETLDHPGLLGILIQTPQGILLNGKEEPAFAGETNIHTVGHKLEDEYKPSLITANYKICLIKPDDSYIPLYENFEDPHKEHKWLPGKGLLVQEGTDIFLYPIEAGVEYKSYHYTHYSKN